MHQPFDSRHAGASSHLNPPWQRSVGARAGERVVALQRLAWATAFALCGAAPLSAAATSATADAAPKAFQAYAHQAQQVRYLQIDSKVLGEQRTVAISLPDSYERASTQHFPVLVLLDGPEQLAHTESLVRFLARGDKSPEMIIVAVANTQRSRDLTPALPADAKTPRPVNSEAATGGANAFLAFLSDELLPTVDQRYRTAPWRGLLGHSYGGLFGLHALVQKPELFRAYLLASPSLWWGDGEPGRRALAAWPHLQSLPKQRLLYLTSGEREQGIADSVDALVKQLRQQPAPRADGLHWSSAHLPGDDHGTTPHLTWLNGLRLAFAQWAYDMPERPTPADYAAYLAHRHQRAARYGVEADPTLFELTRFAVAHAQAAQPRQALALACQLAQRWGDNRRAFGALSRIGGVLQGVEGGRAAARAVYQLALASEPDGDTAPAAIERVRQRAQGDGGAADAGAACAQSMKDRP